MSKEKQIEKQDIIAKLAKDLADAWIVDFEGNPHDLSEILMFSDIANIAEQLVERSYRKQSGWISVKERLPEKEGTYLTYTDKEKTIIDAFCIYPSHGTKFWVGGNGKVTHWMPLPEPPEKREPDCRDCRYFVGCECFSGTPCCDLSKAENQDGGNSGDN